MLWIKQKHYKPEFIHYLLLNFHPFLPKGRYISQIFRRIPRKSRKRVDHREEEKFTLTFEKLLVNLKAFVVKRLRTLI
jgi:hypothetical protein